MSHSGEGDTIMTGPLKAAIGVCGILWASVSDARETRGLRASDFNAYFNRQYPECVGKYGARNAVVNLSVTFHDFAGDGKEEAVVVGASCNAGTGGPDIHAVYRLDKAGQLTALKIRDDATFQGRQVDADLIGNRNFDFEINKDRLCEAFTDSSGRERPLTVCYALRGGEFVIDSLQRGPVYKTSFDCATAGEAWARTVCGTKALASADVEMHAIYEQLLQLRPDQKAALEAEQGDWLKRIGAQPASKFYGDFLRDAYADRIAELRSRMK